MEGFYTVARNDFFLSARLIPVGCDLCVIVTGGSAHIGSISLAQPNEPVKTFRRPGHRDDMVSALFAKTLSAHFGANVAILCGIHYDNATPQDIQTLLALSQELLEKTCGNTP